MATRFRRLDWLALGLRCLAEDGPQGLKLAQLCKRGKRTRGSFYHHFEDMDGFIAAVAAHWRCQHTEALIEKTRQGSPKSRLAALNELATQSDPRIEVGMRRLANAHASVSQTVADVDAERVAYLESLWRAAKVVSRKRAGQLARVEYAAFVGGQTLWPEMAEGDAAQLAGLLSEALWKLAEANRKG